MFPICPALQQLFISYAPSLNFFVHIQARIYKCISLYIYTHTHTPTPLHTKCQNYLSFLLWSVFLVTYLRNLSHSEFNNIWCFRLKVVYSCALILFNLIWVVNCLRTPDQIAYIFSLIFLMLPLWHMPGSYMYMWACFWAFCSVPLVFLFIPTVIWSCFSHYNFIKNLIW